MDFRETVRYIKEKHTKDYIEQSRGVTIQGEYKNGTSRTFKCINPAHKDNNPSMYYSYDTHTAICRTCKAKYGIFDLIGEDYGLSDFKDQVKKAAELFNIKIDSAPRKSSPEEDFREVDGQNQDKAGQYTHTHTDTYTHTDKKKPEENKSAYYVECKKHLSETDYYRGLSAAILEKHFVGFDPCFKTRDSAGNLTQWRALIIPTGKSSFVARNTDNNAAKGDRYRKRGAAQIFAYKTLQTASKPIFVVEGEIDAMSIEEAGGAAIGLGSLDNIQILLRYLETNKPAQPLIIALDNESDPAKREAVEKHEQELRKGLEKLSITYYRLNPYGDHKDANEALLSDREAFIEAVTGAEHIEEQAQEEERQNYLSTSAGAHLQEFVDFITESVNTEAIPTGFETLDTVLDGGLYEGLVTVGAISSLGKTSLMLQVADQVAKAGHDVLIFSLEMARAELMSKSISRHTLQLALEQKIDTRNAKTARGITSGKKHVNYNATERGLIDHAIESYGEYAERIYIQEGIGDIGAAQIRETIEKHILFTGGKWEVDEKTGEKKLSGGRRPLVIVDYLQIVAPYSERMSDKQNTDKAVLELKRISRDYKVPLVAVSSFNRGNYQTEAAFEAFKESGAIEYGSDIVIGLQLKGAGEKTFNATEAKKRNPRQVELVILKNRSGKVGDKILFEYYPMFNYFEDKGISN